MHVAESSGDTQEFAALDWTIGLIGARLGLVLFDKVKPVRSRQRSSRIPGRRFRTTPAFSEHDRASVRHRHNHCQAVDAAMRSGTVRIVYRLGSSPAVTSVQFNGIETVAPAAREATGARLPSPSGHCANSRGRHGLGAGFGHIDQITVRIVACHVLADVAGKGLASAQVTSRPLARGKAAVTTCNPLPPVVLQKLTSPRSASRSRMSCAASMTVSKSTSGRDRDRRPGDRGPRDAQARSSRGEARARRFGRWRQSLRMRSICRYGFLSPET